MRASMFRSDDDARKIGIAVLVAAAMLTGFLVATTATGQDYTTVGTATGDQEAYALSVEEDQRLRFQLEDPKEHSSASLAVYDPDDAYFASFDLEGEDDAEMITDKSGAWVVFVTQAIDADVAVQAAEAEDSAVELTPIDVTEERRSVAAQDGDSLDEQLTLRVSPRPAVAYLAAQGAYEGLDATLSTDEGTVHAIEDARANDTQSGESLSADAVFEPGNLVDGTYTAEATADSFDGELSVVYKAYDRGEVEAEPAEAEVNETPDPLEDATRVTTAGFQEAHRVPTAGADELVFAVPHDSSAEVYVYNGSDEMAHVVEVGGDDYECCSEEDHGNESSEAQRANVTTSVEAPAEEAVVFVRHIQDDEEVVVALEGVQAAPAAEELDLEHTEITVDHSENMSASEELEGALVLFEIEPSYDMSLEREVTLTGPLGEISSMHQYGSGVAGWDEHEVHEDRFSDGEMVLEVQQEGLFEQGETNAVLTHYVR